MLPNTENPILITTPITSRQDLYTALAHAAHPCCHTGQTQNFVIPRNLDGMADLLREFCIKSIVCSDWRLDETDTKAIQEVLKNVQVRLQR